MKKVLSAILSVIVLTVVALLLISQLKKDAPIVIAKGNLKQKPLPIKLNKTNDTECAMLIKTQVNAAEVALKDGRTWFFDDPGCMVKWIKDKPFKDSAKLWIYTVDTHRWVDAKKAKYLTTYHSAMHYGFGAVEKEKNGTIDFNEMVLRMYRNETMANPKFRKKLLGQ